MILFSCTRSANVYFQGHGRSNLSFKREFHRAQKVEGALSTCCIVPPQRNLISNLHWHEKLVIAWSKGPTKRSMFTENLMAAADIREVISTG